MRFRQGFIGICVTFLLWLQVGPSHASLAEGVAAYEKGQFANALQYLLPLAEDGDADAQYHLGLMYVEGKGVRTDPVQAREWFEQAARAGHAGAQFQLGRIHAEGRGVPADGNKASHWYLLAAGQGYLDAQYSLGTMFKLGKGVPEDPVQAYLWFNRAAEQGLGNARVQRDFLAARLTPQQLQEAQDILAEVERAREEAAREAEQERARRAEEASRRRAEREEAARREAERQEALRRQAAEETARREAEARRQAAVTAAAQEQAKARAEAEAQAAERAREAEQQQAEAARAQSGTSDRERLQVMFREDFERDAREAAERLRNFNPDQEITPSRLLSVEELKVTEMNDGTSLVYVRFIMQKLHKGAGEAAVKETAKWFKVRRTGDDFELVSDP